MLTNLWKQIPNGITTFLEAPFDANVLVNELQLFIELPSVTEMTTYSDDPLLSEYQKDAIFWKQANLAPNKKVVCYWNNGADRRLLSFIVFRRDPYYTENLLTRYTSNGSFILQAGTKLRLGIEETNSGLLGASDKLTVWGQAEVLGV